MPTIAEKRRLAHTSSEILWLKTARIWQDVLLWGGAVVSLVGAWELQNTVAALVGLMMMGASLIVWWRFYRCPKCGEHLGRGNPKRCPHCGAWIADEPEPEQKKKIQHKKKKH